MLPSDEIASGVNTRIRQIRGTLSQKEFAVRIGIPQVTLSNYERGRNKPRLEIVKKICEEFNVSAEWLLFGEEKPMKVESEILAENKANNYSDTMTDTGLQTIGKRIREIRGIRSQKEFSQLVGIHKSSLGRYERDECPLPSNEVEKICGTLSIDANWLLFGKGPQKSAGEQNAHGPTKMGNHQNMDFCKGCALLERLLDAEREERRAKEMEIRELTRHVTELKARLEAK